MAQNPWDAAPIVSGSPRSRESQQPAYGVVAESYTNEPAEQLRAQGYELEPSTGKWVKVVGTAPYPGSQQAPSPWDAAPVATESEALAAQRAATTNGAYDAGNSVYQGLLAGFADELAGKSAGLGQLGRNAIRRVRGQPIEINSADLSDAVTNEWRQQERRFAQSNPVQNIGGQVAGGLLTGGGAIGTGVRGAAITGAAYGATSGAGNAEGGVIERLPSAAVGGVVGGALGGAVQGAGQVAAPYISRIAGITGAASNPIRNAAARRNADPETRAAMRFVDTLDPQAAFAERARLQSLGIQPSLADVGGNTSERLIRTAAGPAGPAADLAVRNARSRTVDLKPEIMGVTRGLSPDPRTASQLREGLEETRDTLATQQYREPYAAQVPLTPEAVRALRGPNGAAAIREAIEDELADPNYDAAVVEELQGLLTADLDALPSVSGRALDRARIALRDTSGGLMRGERPNRTRARGFAQRVEGVDTALDAAPGLTEARGVYRELSGAIDQLDESSAIFSTDPVDFAGRVAQMTPTQREAAIIGLRQEILDTLGGQRAAGTGSLQNLSESNYARENLATLLGPKEAAQYIGRIEAGVQQAQRANRISPNTNSQTFGRSIDEDTFSAANMIGAGVDAIQGARGNVVAIGRTIDRIRARATMSPEERQAIAQLGLGSADELERIVQLADQARATGRRTPREVRAYILRTRNVLGAQTPEQLQIERLLLPAPASAEEEQQ